MAVQHDPLFRSSNENKARAHPNAGLAFQNLTDRCGAQTSATPQ